MSLLHRRKFISSSMGALTAKSLLGFSSRAFGKTGSQSAPLMKDPQKIIDLPAGFSYKILDRSGLKMDDGFTSPGRPDGMGCFKVGTQLVLMRNHELSPSHRAPQPYSPGSAPKQAFDSRGVGGVSRLVLEEKSHKVISRNMVLAGTHLNCAGGISPWGWLSCEETIAEGHGYVFLCDPQTPLLVSARPIKSYGRFNHEAVCIEPETNAAYLTEDRGDSCLYRLLPNDKKKPFVGAFQALAIKGKPKMSLASSGLKIGEELSLEWVNLDQQDSKEDDLRYRAQKIGAAIISRGEGIWFSQQGIYFTSTSGGPAGAGQIFRISLNANTLTLVAESQSRDELDMPDNITVSPWGDLVVAEDGERTPHIRMISKTGKIYDIARNAAGYGEFAGVCFAPDGKTLFANMQVQGLTIAIQGPFTKLSLEG